MVVRARRRVLLLVVVVLLLGAVAVHAGRGQSQEGHEDEEGYADEEQGQGGEEEGYADEQGQGVEEGYADEEQGQGGEEEDSDDPVSQVVGAAQEQVMQGLNSLGIKVDGAHLILPVLGKISFDAERMMVGKEMEIKMLGKPALLVVETSNDGSSLQFVLDGPAPLSGLVAGRPDMLNSPIGKLLSKIALRDVEVSVSTPHSIVALLKRNISPLEFAEGIELSLQATADFGKADIQGLPKVGSVSLSASYGIDGLDILVESSKLNNFAIKFLPGSSLQVKRGKLHITIAREETTPTEIDAVPRSKMKMPEPHETTPEDIHEPTTIVPEDEEGGEEIDEDDNDGGGEGVLLLAESGAPGRRTSTSRTTAKRGTTSRANATKASTSKAVATREPTSKTPPAKKRPKSSINFCLECSTSLKVPFLKQIDSDMSICVNPTSGTLDIDADFQMKIKLLFLHLSELHFQAGIQYKPTLSGSFMLSAKTEILSIPVNLDVKYAEKALDLEATPSRNEPVHLTKMFPVLKSLPKKLTDIQLNDFLFRGTLGPGKNSNIFIRGDATIMGLRVIVEVKIETGSGNDQQEVAAPAASAGSKIVVKGILPGDQTQLKGSFLGAFAGIIDRAVILVSTYRHQDEEFEKELPKGLAFYARLKPAGFMVKVSNMVKGLCKQNLDFGGISAFGIVDSENPRNSEFEINMPAFPRGIFGTKKVWPGPFSLRITGKPSFGFQLSIFAQFDKNKLEFMARFELDPVSITINAAMKGMWREPFGLKGFAFGDVALSVSVNWQTGLPSGFGITGKMEIGTRKMSFALAVDAMNGFLISGSISKLTLKDIVMLGKKVGIPLSANAIQAVPKVELQDFRVHYATMDMAIGPFKFKQGFRLTGRLTILKFSLVVDVSVGRNGILAYGEMSEIKLGPLRIFRPTKHTPPPIEVTAAALRQVKMIKGAKDVKGLPPAKPKPLGGPVLYIEMNQQKQIVYFSGGVELLGSKLSVTLYISSTQLSAQFELQLGKIFWINVNLKAAFKKLDFTIDAKMKNDFGASVRKAVDNGIKKGVNAIEKKKKAVANARKSAYDKLNKEIAGYKRTIASLEKKKANLKRQLLVLLVAAHYSVDELEGAGWAKKIARGFKKVGGAIKKTVKKVATKVKTGVVKAANTVKAGVQKAARWAKIQAQLVAIEAQIKWNQAKMWGVEKIAKGAVYVGTKIASGVLTFVQAAMKAVNAAIQWLLSRFSIISGEFKCSVASKTASGSIVYRLGTPSDKRLSFNLNFSNPKAMISSVASGFVKNILGSSSVKKAIGVIPLIDVDSHLEGVPLSLQDKADLKTMVRAIELDALQQEGLLLSL